MPVSMGWTTPCLTSFAWKSCFSISGYHFNSALYFSGMIGSLIDFSFESTVGTYSITLLLGLVPVLMVHCYEQCGFLAVLWCLPFCPPALVDLDDDDFWHDDVIHDIIVAFAFSFARHAVLANWQIGSLFQFCCKSIGVTVNWMGHYQSHICKQGGIFCIFFLLNLIVTKLFQKWFAGKTVLNFKTRFVLVHCLAPSSSHTLNKERSFDSAAFVDMCRLVAICSNYVNPFNSQLENQYQTKVNGILAISPDYYQVICSFHGWQQVQLVHSISVRAWTSSIYHFQLWGFPHLQWMPHTCMLFSLLWTLWLSFHRWLALTGSLPVEQLLWLTLSWGIALWARR